MRRYIAGATLGVLMIAGGGAQTASADINTDQVNKAVVWVDSNWDGQITVPFKDGTTKTYNQKMKSYCTGFFISATAEVATAGHCVEPSRVLEVALITQFIKDNELDITTDPKDLTWKVSFATPTMMVGQPNITNGGPLAGKDLILAQLVEHQPFENGDNALLRLANMTVTDYLKLSPTKPKAQDKVSSIGFPASVDKVTDVARNPASITAGTVSSLSQTQKGVPVIQINAGVSGGMSGGPTVNEAGEVVGINSFGIVGESQPFNFVTDTDVMKKFFESQGVKGEIVNPTPTVKADINALPASQESGSGFPWLLVAAIVGGLLLIGIIGALVVALRRKNASAQTTPTQPLVQAGPPTQG